MKSSTALNKESKEEDLQSEQVATETLEAELKGYQRELADLTENLFQIEPNAVDEFTNLKI